MGKTNGRPELDNVSLDLEHELPESGDRGENTVASSGGEPSAGLSELQKLQAERDTLLDRMARMQAEFDNVRKRTAKEQQEFRDYAAADAIKSLLPVLDSFERALQVKADPAEFRGGVELIYKQLQTALEKLSLQPIKATGELFNPHVHEAIEMVDTTDVPDHQVIEELQRGYKLKDRLLRPAMVKVARNPGK
ncbi:MAG: nucleotide exchange factor GrpE [Candidatus Sulfotelmatobacter sp.]|jgi:molecular chaperone GrpE